MSDTLRAIGEMEEFNIQAFKKFNQFKKFKFKNTILKLGDFRRVRWIPYR